MGLIMESNKNGNISRPLSDYCNFSCMNSTSCMFKAVGDCYNCEKVSCENCVHWDKSNGCELANNDPDLHRFYTELIIEQNEQK